MTVMLNEAKAIHYFIEKNKLNLYLDMITRTLFLNKKELTLTQINKLHSEFIKIPTRFDQWNLIEFEENLMAFVYYYNPVNKFAGNDKIQNSEARPSFDEVADCLIFNSALSAQENEKKKAAASSILHYWFFELHMSTFYSAPCKTMLVLQGPKGIGKKTFIESLFPRQLNKYINISPFGSRYEDIVLCKNILRVYNYPDTISKKKKNELHEVLNNKTASFMTKSGRLESNIIKKSMLCAITERVFPFNVNSIYMPHIQIDGIDFEKLEKINKNVLFYNTNCEAFDSLPKIKFSLKSDEYEF